LKEKGNKEPTLEELWKEDMKPRPIPTPKEGAPSTLFWRKKKTPSTSSNETPTSSEPASAPSEETKEN